MTETLTFHAEFDEEDLIQRSQQGETDAFNPLVRKHHSRVYNHILGKVRDPEIAKDLCQETWLKAFRALRTFRGDSAFSSWLYRIAENVCIDYARKQHKEHDIEPLHEINEHLITDTPPSPSHVIERQELREHLQAAIAELTPMRKEVVRLYYIHQLSVKTIAIRLKRSEGTIKSHLRNARLQLKERLTPYLIDGSLHLFGHN